MKKNKKAVVKKAGKPAVKKPAVLKKLLKKGAKLKAYDQIYELARTTTNLDLLDELSNDDNLFVRLEVAKNPEIDDLHVTNLLEKDCNKELF